MKPILNTMLLSKFFVFLVLIGSAQQSLAITKQGNYLDVRIGDAKDTTFEALVYYPDREWLYDFDTPSPFDGITVSSGAIEANTDFFMSQPQSMRWNTAPGSSLTLDANILLKKIYKNYYYLTVGVFQEDVPTGAGKRVFNVELLSSSGSVITSRSIYMHRGGWNILCSEMPFSGDQMVGKVRITQTAGSAGSVLLDNFMISAFQVKSKVFMFNGTVDVEQARLSLDKAEDFPAEPLTDAERDAFLTVSERVIPLPERTGGIPSEKMEEFRALHAHYNIVGRGEYASGLSPLYYWRSVTQTANAFYIGWEQNTQLCSGMKEIGMSWYQTTDAAQKEELGHMVTDLVRLAVTYGGMPNAWYNGRGFAEGVYYAKELLESEGLLDRVTQLIQQQYGVATILFNEQRWDNPLYLEKGNSPDLFWQATADNLNTASRSMILSVLVGADTAEKARNMKRLKSWLDHIALTYSPNDYGTFKPDGSMFHHWGNRFDNYAWVAGWRGATEWVWWLSHTPFAVSAETKERMNYLADVHFDVMSRDGHVASQDKMHYVPSSSFLDLALAGSPDGSLEIDPEMASYWMAYPGDYSYKGNPDLVNWMQALGITAAEKRDGNRTLSYDTCNVHRQGQWQAYTRGISKNFYHTQYKRDGFLFYNIGGISLVKEGEASGLQKSYGATLLNPANIAVLELTPGYNLSRAPGVTSVNTDYSNLRQLYYQRGSSPFVGGVSTADGLGVFVQEFNAEENSKYKNTVASGLQFKKSYFYFGNDIVMLASGILNEGGTADVETGLLQEPASKGRNVFTFANGVQTTDLEYNLDYSSTDVPWMYNSTLNLGAYLMPGQDYQLHKGAQSFGPLTGNIVSTYLDHSGQTNGWYECILRLNTTRRGMRELSENMGSDDPNYEILMRDDKAHVVRGGNHDTTGYAIFDPSGLKLPYATLRSVDKECVVMLKKQGRYVDIAVAYPDQRMERTENNPLGWSQPTDVTLRLNGMFDPAPGADCYVSVDEATKKTTVSVTLKDGLTKEISVVRRP